MRALALGLTFTCGVLVPGQEPPDDTFGHSRHGGEFDEGPRQAAYLMAGISDQVRFPIAGLSAEAQRFFNQGLCQQHGFWYFEAERSFRQVAKLHPDCAMAYWGMAMANVENPRRAAGLAAQAVQRREGATERERLWIDAIARLYQIDDAARAELQSADPEKVKAAREAVVKHNEQRDEKKLGREFVRGLEAVVFACPEDIEAKAFLAIQSWRNVEHGIEITNHGAVDALLAQVFEKAEGHPAHHYRIHLWDYEKAERALGSARANGATVPTIAHQWHMPGHIYARLHRHAEAAWQQEASGRVDHAHMMHDRVMPYEIHNYGHNQEWLCRSLSHVGRVREALDLARNMAGLPRHPKFNQIDKGRDIAGYARARLVDLCEDHELWEETVLLTRDGLLEAAENVRAETGRLALQGRALFRLGRTAEAERVVADVAALLVRARKLRAEAVDAAEDEAIGRKDPEDKVRQGVEAAVRDKTDPVRAVLMLQRELHAEQLLAGGDAKAALEEFAAVRGLSKTLLADAQVAAGEAQKAVETLEKEVQDRPDRVPTLARLVLALEAAGNREAAATKFAELRRVAGEGDLDTPLLRRLRPLAAALELPADWREPQPFGADFGERPPLASLGPFRWCPVAAPGFDLPVAEGGRVTLAQHRGRPTLVVFYLGFGCLHCIEQLQAFAPRSKEFADAGIQIVAIGSEDAAKAAQSLAAMGEADRFRFPLLADPELTAFRAWRCYDDFESMPLHGTFLIDSEGLVRWQDISFEPFTKVDWLLGECRRLLALPAGAGGK